MEKPMAEKKHPWFLWPFVALWSLLTAILKMTGRLVAALLGIALIAVGIILTITLLAAPLGIPIGVLGFLLLVRSVF
jgi:hypothetical protein